LGIIYNYTNDARTHERKFTNSESTLSRGFQEHMIRYFQAGNYQYTKWASYRTFSRA